MEKGIDSYLKEQFEIPDVDIRTYSPLTLAYIGDGIYDLVIRSLVVAKGNTRASELHKRTSQIVKAHTQAEMMEVLLPILTEEEAAVYKRGRNAKSFTMAKNATMSDYRKATGDTTKTLIASTASPYKFSPSVLEAIAKEPVSGDEYAMVDQLHELSNLPIPAALADLKNKERRFTSCIDKNDLQSFVLQQLHLG